MNQVSLFHEDDSELTALPLLVDDVFHIFTVIQRSAQTGSWRIDAHDKEVAGKTTTIIANPGSRAVTYFYRGPICPSFMDIYLNSF